MTLEKIRFEKEMYEPLRQYLIDAGFEVRAEVKTCDLVARKPDQLIIVEMKRHLSFDLLVQAVERQGYADGVYVAIPKPAAFTQDKEWRARSRVLRQLGLGLLLVGRIGECYFVETALMPEPVPEKPRQARAAPKKRRSLEKEFANRRLDLNTGGTRGVPLVTAYRESALLVAHLLDIKGPLTPKALRLLGSDPKKTLGILRLNPYGWFEARPEHTYALTTAGGEALITYAPLIDAFRLLALTDVGLPPVADAFEGDAGEPAGTRQDGRKRKRNEP